MLTDAQLLFSSAQAITSTALSTNTIDLGVLEDLGIGTYTLDLAIYVGTAFTAAGAATLTVQVQTSTDNSTWKTISQTDAIGKATLTANAEIPISLTKRGAGIALSRYLALNYVVATGPMTAGTLTALLLPYRDTAQTLGQYANGYTVGS